MPFLIPVVGLETLTVKCVASLILNICKNKCLQPCDLPPIIDYFQNVPKLLQKKICRILVDDYKERNDSINEKHLYILILLCSEELFLNEFCHSVHFLNSQSAPEARKLTFRGGHFLFPMEQQEVSLRFVAYGPLYAFMRTLQNLTTFHSTQMCDDTIFYLFSQHCPLLEEIWVELTYTLGDLGAAHLCGFDSIEEAERMIGAGEEIKIKNGCKNLKRVTLEYTLTSDLGVALLQRWCPKLEVLEVNPDINISNVFSLLHGIDPENVEGVNRRYNLVLLKSNLEIEESTLCLIGQTCPNLTNVTLRCFGCRRKDKNMLANLLSLPIHTLHLMNCHTEALLWFLARKGRTMKTLNIEHLLNAPYSATVTRSNLQSIIELCPNLMAFSLKLCGSVSILPDVPYSTFERVHYFTTLKELVIENVKLEPEDARILLSKCEPLSDITFLCHSSDMLYDTFLRELLASGSLKNLKSLYILGTSLTLEALLRLIHKCPMLKSVGPLSSWTINTSDMEKFTNLIKESNWDFEVGVPDHLVATGLTV